MPFPSLKRTLAGFLAFVVALSGVYLPRSASAETTPAYQVTETQAEGFLQSLRGQRDEIGKLRIFVNDRTRTDAGKVSQFKAIQEEVLGRLDRAIGKLDRGEDAGAELDFLMQPSVVNKTAYLRTYLWNVAKAREALGFGYEEDPTASLTTVLALSDPSVDFRKFVGARIFEALLDAVNETDPEEWNQLSFLLTLGHSVNLQNYVVRRILDTAQIARDARSEQEATREAVTSSTGVLDRLWFLLKNQDPEEPIDEALREISGLEFDARTYLTKGFHVALATIRKNQLFYVAEVEEGPRTIQGWVAETVNREETTERSNPAAQSNDDLGPQAEAAPDVTEDYEAPTSVEPAEPDDDYPVADQTNRPRPSVNERDLRDLDRAVELNDLRNGSPFDPTPVPTATPGRMDFKVDLSRYRMETARDNTNVVTKVPGELFRPSRIRFLYPPEELEREIEAAKGKPGADLFTPTLKLFANLDGMYSDYAAEVAWVSNGARNRAIGIATDAKYFSLAVTAALAAGTFGAGAVGVVSNALFFGLMIADEAMMMGREWRAGASSGEIAKTHAFSLILYSWLGVQKVKCVRDAFRAYKTLRLFQTGISAFFVVDLSKAGVEQYQAWRAIDPNDPAAALQRADAIKGMVATLTMLVQSANHIRQAYREGKVIPAYVFETKFYKDAALSRSKQLALRDFFAKLGEMGLRESDFQSPEFREIIARFEQAHQESLAQPAGNRQMTQAHFYARDLLADYFLRDPKRFPGVTRQQVNALIAPLFKTRVLGGAPASPSGEPTGILPERISSKLSDVPQLRDPANSYFTGIVKPFLGRLQVLGVDLNQTTEAVDAALIQILNKGCSAKYPPSWGGKLTGKDLAALQKALKDAGKVVSDKEMSDLVEGEVSPAMVKVFADQLKETASQSNAFDATLKTLGVAGEADRNALSQYAKGSETNSIGDKIGSIRWTAKFWQRLSKALGREASDEEVSSVVKHESTRSMPNETMASEWREYTRGKELYRYLGDSRFAGKLSPVAEDFLYDLVAKREMPLNEKTRMIVDEIVTEGLTGQRAAKLDLAWERSGGGEDVIRALLQKYSDATNVRFYDSWKTDWTDNQRRLAREQEQADQAASDAEYRNKVSGRAVPPYFERDVGFVRAAFEAEKNGNPAPKKAVDEFFTWLRGKGIDDAAFERHRSLFGSWKPGEGSTVAKQDFLRLLKEYAEEGKTIEIAEVDRWFLRLENAKAGTPSFHRVSAEGTKFRYDTTLEPSFENGLLSAQAKAVRDYVSGVASGFEMDLRLGNLLKAEVSPSEIRLKDGLNLLSLAAETGQYQHVARLIRDFGFDVNAADSHGETPLMKAAYEGKTETVRVLLENKADPGLLDRNGKSAAAHANDGLLKYREKKGANELPEYDDYWRTEWNYEQIGRMLR